MKRNAFAVSPGPITWRWSPGSDDLIHGVHAAPLLFAHRGTPPVDTAALTDMLLRVSRLADDLRAVAELDLNPVIATPADNPLLEAAPGTGE